MTWIEVGSNIFCVRYEPLDQTIGAIRTGDGLVAIDSRSHRVHAQELLGDLRTLDPRAPVYLINTHYHWDHSFGNDQFGSSVTIGHAKTREALIERGVAMRDELVQADWLKPETAQLISEIEVAPPTVTFDRSMSLVLGDQEIELTHLGRGHTDSDIVIAVDDVLFAGDLIEVGAPPSFGDSFPTEWVETLEQMAPLCVGAVVPGHGDVVDRSFVEAQTEEIRRAVAGEAVYPEAVMAQIASRR